MRIRTLTFRGVGPYLDEQHIDFDQLTDRSGLYLINGPTGAGKSTIIDCICFALYGKLAGDESDPSRMRSHFAEAKHPTEVDLVFQTSNGVFRVIRKPQYMRTKQRGEGETEQKAECKLIRKHEDGHEETIATNVASANAELENIVGLTRDQFVQTVVLPQGEFAKFLHEDTKGREAILKRIFGTRLFERVAEILKEDAKQAGIAKEAATQLIREAVLAIDVHLTLQADVKEVLLNHVAQSLDDLLLAELEALQPELDQDAAAAAKLAEQADLKFNEADAKRTLTAKEADATKAITDALQRVEAARQAVSTERIPVDAARALAATMQISIDDSESEQDWLNRASDAATAAGQLQALCEEEKALTDWPSEKAEKEAALDALRTSMEQSRARSGEIPALIEQQEAVIADRPTATEIRELGDRKSELDTEAATRKQVDKEERRQVGLKQAADAAIKGSRDADDEYQRASALHREGIAAELALQLEEGKPCPVCGSVEHPSKAQPSDGNVSTEEVDALQEKAANARAAMASAREALDTSNARITELKTTLKMTGEELEAAQQALTDAQRELEKRTVEAAAADLIVKALRAELTELQKSDSEKVTKIATVKAKLDSDAESMRKLEKQVLQHRADFPSVAARKAAIEDLQSRLRKLAIAYGDAQRAANEYNQAQQILDQFEKRDDFGDTRAAASAWEIAKAEQSKAELASQTARGRARALLDGIGTVREACAARAELVGSKADLFDLADLFNAGRGAAFGLHIYVLQSLFANVVERANRRFETLLGGRFQLVSTDDNDADGRSRQGLGLAVIDALTGTQRRATTMSGGETFCASLTLALGLADVVRITSGGIEISSMFIDEGFGSLDVDQLNDVMAMLAQLGSHGRLVGVISHVADMKAAINERIDITPASESRPARLAVSWMP